MCFFREREEEREKKGERNPFVVPFIHNSFAASSTCADLG